MGRYANGREVTDGNSEQVGLVYRPHTDHVSDFTDHTGTFAGQAVREMVCSVKQRRSPSLAFSSGGT